MIGRPSEHDLSFKELPIHSIDYTIAFMTGLLGSFHCVGMCGGITGALAMGPKGMSLPGLAAYHLARLYTYATLGLLAGWLGKVIIGTALMEHAQRNLALLAGTIMIFFALQIGGWIPERFGRLSKLTIPAALLKQVSGSNAVIAWGVVGLINGLLPCGLVYAALSLAMKEGSAFTGAFIMLSFGLGTVPAMTTFALIIRKVSPLLRGRLIKASALLVIAFGIVTMIRGVMPQQHHGMMMEGTSMNGKSH